MKKVTNFDGFDIYFEAEKEFIPMRKHFVEECGWSKDEYASLVSDKPKWFSAHVVAKKGDIELGEAYLGCCCYNSHEEFYARYADGYFKDMMKEAVEEAKARLPDVLKDLRSKASTLARSIKVLETNTLIVN